MVMQGAMFESVQKACKSLMSMLLRVFNDSGIATMYKPHIFILLLLIACSLASCASKTSKEKPSEIKKASSLSFPSDGQSQFVNIANLYDRFSPRQNGFDSLFKSNLPDAAYRRYAQLLEEKLKNHRKKKRFYEVKLLSKERISSRKRQSKKEWSWGKNRKTKLLGYYRYFRQPFSMYEFKVSYRTTPFNEQGVTDKSPKKTIPTEQRYILYFYKARGIEQVYLVDPDIFIQSIL
jgi:hypothetical protein